MKTFLLTLAAVIVAALQASYAGDDFRVTIVKGDGELKLTAEQIDQFKKAGIASPDDLPIIVCPSNAKPKLVGEGHPADTFQIVIENLHDNALSITMLDSDWYDAITFKLVDDKGTAYTIRHSGISDWQKNGNQTWTWDAHGTRKVATSFVKEWSGLPPSPEHPIACQLTATFRYHSEGKQVEVSSKPTTVILMPQ